MSIHYQLLAHTSLIQRMFRKFGIKFGLISPNRLRVLIYHDIPAEEENNFALQLRWLKQSWNIVSPTEFEKMLSGEKSIIGDNLLITFDDGLISNRIVAEKILNPMDIKAIFFIISDFAQIKDPVEARQFIADNIIPGSNIEDIPKHWKNMQWHDLAYLIEQGHMIGCHTKTHARLSHCTSESGLEEEILTSASKISDKLHIDINHFAYTFGDINSFSQAAMKIAKRQFNFVYSGVRGNNSEHISPLAIRRDAAAYQLKNNEYRIFDNKLLTAFLDGFADFRYKKPKDILDKWCQ